MSEDTKSAQLIQQLTQDLKVLNSHVEYTDQNLDDLFFVINGLLVLFMQVGFACLEAGAIRSKNVANIMLKNFLDSFICSIVFWLIGYALAFGNGNSFVGLTWWATIGLPPQFWGLWFFQYTFASTASTILSGAVAERCTFVAYLLYSALMSGIIYPVVIHWAWSNQGWLYRMNFEDFAGGMLVHGLAGSACLIAATLIGPRMGRFENKHSKQIPGIGGIVLIVGFCGFNAGTLNHYSEPNDGQITICIVRNTIMSGASACLTVLFAGKLGLLGESFWPFSLSINGGIAGLVSSCGGCNIFTPLESIITGFIGAVVYMCFRGIILYFRIDDPLDSSPIHMGGGIWSVLAVPLVGNGGIIRNPIMPQLKKVFVQAEGAVCIMVWSLLSSFILFGMLKIFKILRSSNEEEVLGMDMTKHKEMPNDGENIQNLENNMLMNNITGQRISVICATSF